MLMRTGQKEDPAGGWVNIGAHAKARGVLLPRCALSASPTLLFPALSSCHFLPLSSKAFVPVSLLPPFSPSAPHLFLPRPISGLFNSL